MHLLVGLITILYLAISEINAQAPVDDVLVRVISLLLVTASVPGLAMFQTAIVSQRFKRSELTAEQRQSSWERLTMCHTAVWLAASLLIVCNIQWHSIVRNNWALGSWPLVDEMIILFPVVLSLVASWAIFFDLAYSDAERTWKARLNSVFSKERFAFVLVRLRVYAALTLLPITIFVLLKDLAVVYEKMPAIAITVTLVVSFAVVVGYPYLIGLIWNLQPIKDPELANDLEQFCEEQRLGVRGVKVWNTNNQILNAMVAGLIPKIRVIVITDGLLTRFPQNEMLAILRHEAGHIRLWHLPIRIGFVLLPLILFAVAETYGLSISGKLNASLGRAGIVLPEVWMAPAALFGIYLLATLSWLSRKMEYEADLFASTGTPAASPGDMLDALLRFASHFPDQLDKRSLLHPSLRQRMNRIVKIREKQFDHVEFAMTWQRQKLFLLISIVAVCFAIVLL